jgi:hypothetical protein
MYHTILNVKHINHTNDSILFKDFNNDTAPNIAKRKIVNNKILYKMKGNTVWMHQLDIAELFDTDKQLPLELSTQT